jgi:hypothetical protein
MRINRLFLVAPAAFLVLGLAACGGDDDGEGSELDGDSTATSQSTSATGTAGDPDEPDSDDDDDADSVGVIVPLEAGSTGEITASDVGTVTMTIINILSPADEILGFGLEPEPGFQVWAVEATITATGGDMGGAAPDWYVETNTGTVYSWTGTGGGNDLWNGMIGPDSPAEGYIAFQIPEGEEVVRLTALFSIYVGYDMVFER